ncbi:hypothetical protein QJS66_01025 [Kocuria rhizophila]|nr:hypothetical protein QJS66_01025 [Kocuria rhizophila]
MVAAGARVLVTPGLALFCGGHDPGQGRAEHDDDELRGPGRGGGRVGAVGGASMRGSPCCGGLTANPYARGCGVSAPRTCWPRTSP